MAAVHAAPSVRKHVETKSLNFVATTFRGKSGRPSLLSTTN